MWVVSRPNTKMVAYSLLPFCEEQPKPLPVEWPPSFTPYMKHISAPDHFDLTQMTLNNVTEYLQSQTLQGHTKRTKERNFFFLFHPRIYWEKEFEDPHFRAIVPHCCGV